MDFLIYSLDDDVRDVFILSPFLSSYFTLTVLLLFRYFGWFDELLLLASFIPKSNDLVYLGIGTILLLLAAWCYWALSFLASSDIWLRHAYAFIILACLSYSILYCLALSGIF